MVPALSQMPMWPTNGMNHVITGIGVHTMQCGKTFGGRISGGADIGVLLYTVSMHGQHKTTWGSMPEGSAV